MQNSANEEKPATSYLLGNNDHIGGWMDFMEERQTDLVKDKLERMTGGWKFGGSGSWRSAAAQRFVREWA